MFFSLIDLIKKGEEKIDGQMEINKSGVNK